MRLIDADALEKVYVRNSITDTVTVGEKTVLRHLREAPTIDAVPVVRCKDCAKAVRHEVFPRSRRCKVEDCRFSHKETHFCSYGERRSDD